MDVITAQRDSPLRRLLHIRLKSSLFGRTVLCYRTVVLPACLFVCLSVLSVTLVYCGQTVGCINMKLGTEVGLGPGHIVLHGDPSPPPTPKRGDSPQFSAHVYCGQTAGWIKMPLGTKVDLGSGHKKRSQPPSHLSHIYCGQTVAHLSYY